MERSGIGRVAVGRRATRRVLACEGLEGRLVLSTAGVTPPAVLPPMVMFGGPQGGGLMASGTAHREMFVAPGGKWQGPGPGQGQVAFAINPANLSPQAKADLQKLQADMKAIQAKSTVTPAQEQAVRQDFQQIAQYAPPGALVRAKGHEVLAAANGVGHAGAAVRSGQVFVGANDAGHAGAGAAVLVSQDQVQMPADLTAQLQKENVPQSLIDKTVADLQAVQAASNVTPQDIQTITADHQALATDLGHKA